MRCDLNESHLPPVESVAQALRALAGAVHRYPEFRPDRPRRVLAEHLAVEQEMVTVGAGGTAVAQAILTHSVARAREGGIDSPEIVTPGPTFEGFALIAQMLGARIVYTPLDVSGAPDLRALAAAITSRTCAVIVCSPHNPTGSIVAESALVDFLRCVPPALRVILDQAYIEYCEDPPDIHALIAEFNELVVLRTFSKAYGLAGLRVGYAFGDRAAIAAARTYELPFAVNAMAAAAVPIALGARVEIDARITALRAERTRLAAALSALGYGVYPGHANFLYLPGPAGQRAGERLRQAGILGKIYPGEGLRLTVADADTSRAVLAVLGAPVDSPDVPPRRLPPLMRRCRRSAAGNR